MSESLLAARCTLCAWAGDAEGDDCPRCGHTLADYEVTLSE